MYVQRVLPLGRLAIIFIRLHPLLRWHFDLFEFGA
jgi:hypothetical protein